MPPPTTPIDDAADIFAALRRRLFGIAYRMLGSAAEAEDVVQDTWLRWQGADRDVVRSPAAFLVTTTTRLAINAAQSARSRRETYIGPWLPEPVDTSADPALGAERSQALEFAVLMLLEKLSPAERAAYVLSEAFDYPYAQIAEALDVSEANARQLASRARKRLAAERRDPVAPATQRRLLDAFLTAARSGRLETLHGLFVSDITSYSDGGGAVRAAGKPVAGAARVARFIAAVSRWVWTDATVTPVDANGHAAVLIERDGKPFTLLTVAATDDGIDRIFWVMNPAKLATIVTAATRSRG